MKKTNSGSESRTSLFTFSAYMLVLLLVGCESRPVEIQGARTRWVDGNGRFACTTLQAFQGIYERFEQGDSRGAAHRKAIQKDAKNLALLKPNEEVQVLREKEGYVLISLENRERTFWTRESWLVSQFSAAKPASSLPDNPPASQQQTNLPNNVQELDSNASAMEESLNSPPPMPTENLPAIEDTQAKEAADAFSPDRPPNLGGILNNTTVDPISVNEIELPIDLNKNRNWTTNAGFQFTGSVRNVTDGTAVFLNSETGQERELSIDGFCEADRGLLKSVYYIEEDIKQYQSAAAILEEVADNPSAQISSLKQLHTKYPVSPYAGIWLGACVSAAENDFAEAATILRQVQDRINLQRESVPFRHGMTLASALNNLAVCMIKSHKFDAAAGLLSQAIDEAPSMNPVIVGNARGLLVTEIRGEPAVKPNIRDRLNQSLLNSSAPQQVLPNQAKTPHYCLESNRPDSTSVNLPLAKFRPPNNVSELLGDTTGIAISANTVVCSASAIGLRANGIGSNLYSDAKSDTQSTDKFTVLYIDQSLGISQSNECEISEIDYLRDLVALEVSRNTSTFYPVFNVPANLSSNDGLALFTFDTSSTDLTARSLTTHKTQLQTIDPTITFEVPKGKSGPTLSKDGQLLGIASQRNNTQQFAMTPSAEFIQFCSKHVPALSGTKINVPDQFRRSCVMILRWNGLSDDSPQYLSDFGEHATTKFSFEDPWCIACQGTNRVKCGRCTRGMTTVSKRIIIGRNPITNEDIWGNKAYKTPCGTCGGKGGSTCSFCSNGRRR